MKNLAAKALLVGLIAISIGTSSANASQTLDSNQYLKLNHFEDRFQGKTQVVKLTLGYPRSIFSGVPFYITVKASKSVSGTCKVVDFYTGSTKTNAKITKGLAKIKVTNYWITGGLNAAQSFVVTCKGTRWSGTNDTIQWGN
jgi:hypothetical protein